jgi:hypothetical protein
MERPEPHFSAKPTGSKSDLRGQSYLVPPEFGFSQSRVEDQLHGNINLLGFSSRYFMVWSEAYAEV